MAWLEDIATVLVNAGVGVRNTNIFLSSNSAPPSGSGPYLQIIEGPGWVPERIHNQNQPAYMRPGAQILVRAADYSAARAMAMAAFIAVGSIYNQTINTVWYREILARQHPFDLGVDDSGRARVVFNIVGARGALVNE